MLKLQSTLVQDTWVKAGQAGPRQTLTGVDILHGHVAVPAFFVYPQGLDAERALQGLRDTLPHYPLISGRLVKDERGQVVCDGSDSGVQWRVLRCKGPTPVGEHRPPLGDIKAFYTSFMPWQVVGRNTPTLQVSIHQFDDGGATLAMRIVHSQFDGSSLFGFMKDWSRACLGQPVVGQTFDRDQMIRIGAGTLLPAQPLGMISRPPLTHFMSVMARLGWRALVDIRKEVFRLPATAIQHWQAQASAQRPDEHAPNAARLASAYVMKALDPHLPKGQDRYLGMVLDMRYVKGLGLSRDYFGNALCYPEASVSEAAARDSSLIELARQLKPDAEQLTAGYLSQVISVLEHARLQNDVPRLLLGPAAHNLGASIFQNNCSQLPVYDFDFGTGPARWYDTIPMTIRMMTLTPTPDKDGGVDIHLCGSTVERNALRACLVADGIAPHPSQMGLAA
jgi:shikimate O-hydroxycinnamoyltransferase